MTPRSRAILCATILTTPVCAAPLLTNGDFEESPFLSGWKSEGVATAPGLNGSAQGAKLPFKTKASLEQEASAPAENFTVDLSFQISGSNEQQAFRCAITAGGEEAVSVRTGKGGSVQVRDGGSYLALKQKAGTGFAVVPNSQTVKMRIVGRNFGTPKAEYDLAWSNPGDAELSHSATGLRAFASTSATKAKASGVRMLRDVFEANSFVVDGVAFSPESATVPPADHIAAAAPAVVSASKEEEPVSNYVASAPDKVVNISGVYPHLAMTSRNDEIGVGAVVPWAGKLWAITYGPHLANGSDDKLYEIAPDLTRVIRPESVGGTPANRFIHKPSSTLIIGPHFIDAKGGVRTMSYAKARGRYTATAAHLTDPNRVYMFTMEDGLYDVNVSNLEDIIVRYPDIQGKGDNFLPGYHGKGAYTGQGRLVVANNGEPNVTYPSGVLASWDGTVRGQGDEHPDWMKSWKIEFRSQHCEVTGPGDLSGNPNPSTDPIWATGFDAKSVVLRVLQGGKWNTWRLPKGSYTHDGAHGWHTEWPRIREIEPGNWLMHMHGIFYQFPVTFSAENFSGLKPICSYEKMPVDYCMWEGKLVMGKNDTSKFDNQLVPRAQSNFWFGKLSDLKKWGAPRGHGSLWLDEDVKADTASEPFLVSGFTQGTLHVRHAGAEALPMIIETSNGDGRWAELQKLNVAAGGYAYQLLNNVNAQWLRVKTTKAATKVTASLLLSNPYPHKAAETAGEFAALAAFDAKTRSIGGAIRTMNDPALPLEYASTDAASAGGYYVAGGALALEPGKDDAAKARMQKLAPKASADVGSDAASAWVMYEKTKLRLPVLDPAYNQTQGETRAFREVVTERQMLNLGGTFYEVPRPNSGGRLRMIPIATHGKRITDYCSWRGLFVATGVREDAAASDKILRSADGTAAVWLGEVDDLWRMGEPRGTGGPWLDTQIKASEASDPFLMYGYDRKEMRLSHNAAKPVKFTVEVDFLGDGSWSQYTTLTVNPNDTVKHVFPEGFHAHWVRLTGDASVRATAQFTYGSVK